MQAGETLERYKTISVLMKSCVSSKFCAPEGQMPPENR